MRELLRLEALGFRHRGAQTPILRDINLTVHEGDRLLIRGRSGSGKSTLLQIMAGLAPDHVTGTLTGSRELFYATAGVVLQNPEAQIVTPTVEEEIAFGLENAGITAEEIRRRIAETLEALGIGSLAQRHPLTLSGGEAQRVSLAAAVALKPEILFLDEPTSFLDEAASVKFFDSLALLPDRTAVLVVEHRIDTAARVCHSCVQVTDEGRLEASDFRPRVVLPVRDFSGGQISAGRRSISSPPVLEVRGLRHRYEKGGEDLFRGVSFTVDSGEVAVLMGPSGCGKSTILSKITRMLKLEEKTVFFAGRDAAKLKLKYFHPAFMYVPQNPEHMFIADSVAEELETAGTGDRSSASALADKFGLDHRLSSHPFRLSEGEKRRLNISVAFASGRPLYILDEPTYGLDEEMKILLTGDVRLLAETGAAVLIVTHDSEFAASAADTVLVMEERTVRKVQMKEVFSETACAAC